MDKRTLLFIVLVTLSFFGINTFFGPKHIPEPNRAESTEKKIPSTLSTSIPVPSVSVSNEKETFYVLENPYLQLVFSNKGGAISEINLPFNSKENTNSVVQPIEIDRLVQETSPENDTFPLMPSHFNGSSQETKESTIGGYYPLLRRAIKQPNGGFLSIPSQFYALSIIDNSSNRETPVYTITRFEKNLIEFQASLPEHRITKTFTLPENDKLPYIFDVEIRVEGESNNLWIGSGIPEIELISGRSTPSLDYRIFKNQKPVVEKISLPKTSSIVSSIHPDWISNSNRFFGTILDPITETPPGYRAEMIPGTRAPTRLSLIDPESNRYPAEKFPGYQLYLPLGSSPITHFRIFAGPYQTTILKTVDHAFSDPSKNYNPSYKDAQTYHGWFSFVSVPFAKFLYFLMELFHSVTHSWGISIILLTIVLRIMLYPLNTWSIKSTLKMQEISPKVKTLQERYKKDPKKAQMEIMKLYRETGANPFTGCFPMLIQMPFLFGMFDLLQTSFQLRGAGFIPGWIDNLTAPDVLFSWSYNIPFLGSQFHLLPILLGVSMYLQQKLSTVLPKDKSQWTDQQKQQHMMTTIMPIVLTFIFYKFPSGLNLYWLSSTLLGIGQQWLMKKRQHPQAVKKS